MIWIPVPKAWPFCVRCQKPIERFVEFSWTPNKDRVRLFVECHGQRQQLEFGPDEIRRLHFTDGRAVFELWGSDALVRRRIEL